MARILWLSLVFTALAAGCFPGWPPEDQPERIGIELSEDGETLTILYGCDARVRYIQLEPWDGDPVWKVVSSRGSSAGSFVLGSTPEGFTEEVGFIGELRDENYLLVVDNTLRTGETESFHPDDLRPGRVLFAGEYLTRAEFVARAEC